MLAKNVADLFALLFEFFELAVRKHNMFGLMPRLPYIALAGCMLPQAALAECPVSQADVLDGVWVSYEMSGQTRLSQYELSEISPAGQLVVTNYDGAVVSHVTTNYANIYPQSVDFSNGSSLLFRWGSGAEHFLEGELSPGVRFTVETIATLYTANGDRRSPGSVSFVVSDDPYMVSLGDCIYEAYELSMRVRMSDFNMDQTTLYHFLPALVLPIAFSFGSTEGAPAQRPQATGIRISTERF